MKGKSIVYGSLVAFWLSGCAASGDQVDFQPVAEGTRINLQMQPPRGEEVDVESQAESVTNQAGKSMVAGAGSGLMGSVLLSALCGSAFMFCLGVSAPYATAAGAVVGTFTGGIAGSFDGLPKEQAEGLEAIVESFIADTAPTARIETAFRDHAGSRLVIDEEANQAIIIQFYGVSVSQPDKQHYVFDLHAQVTLGDNRDPASVSSQVFVLGTPPRTPEYWLREDGINLTRSLLETADRLAEEIAIGVIAPPGARATEADNGEAEF
ncbi:MAG: hypothetical protein AAF660_05280 [Pseudomonadota bacterium]